ncbi:MAG TPA: D-aminoacylase [Longimicrobiales bacterium]|nr:D-aminoacylase [Longimicrobiales bacterium]
MRKVLAALCLLAAAVPAAAQSAGPRGAAPKPATPAAYDVLIRGGRVLDGSGNPWFYADVGVTGDRIAAVGDLSGATAKRVIDAKGLYVTPGFIDVHSHAGPGLAKPALAQGQPLLAQGLTTIFANPDGGGPVDLVKQRAALEKNPLGVNVALMVPHGSVRGAVLGMSDRDPSAAELDRMRSLVRQGMQAGAFGLSDGPYYAPSSYSKTAEIVELAKVASEFGGVYTSHIRDESDYTVGLVAAVDEVITVSREAKLPGVVTHIKALGPHVWGLSDHIVQRIEQAREQGIQVYADQYPYEASGTGITGALVPRWAQVGGDTALVRRIGDATERARMRADMLVNLERRGGADRLQFSDYEPDHSIEGKTLGQVARERNTDPIDLAMELLKKGDAGLVSFNMSEHDIATFMRQPWTMTCTDGGLVAMDDGVPHPRFYGAFPRKIRKYVEEEHVIDLPWAVRSMTSLPAAVFHLDDRGWIRPGMKADILVFDPSRVRDKATYEKPHQLAEGMQYILVNGGVAVDDGRFTGRYGRVLSRKPVT